MTRWLIAYAAWSWTIGSSSSGSWVSWATALLDEPDPIINPSAIELMIPPAWIAL
jgi:hypothetical protein